MTVPAADNLRRHADTHDMVCYGKKCNDCREQRERIAAADLLDAIDALHYPRITVYRPNGDHDAVCAECSDDYPCPTARLLHGEDQ